MERNKEKRLGKSRADKKITGVCGGIAAYLGLSPKLSLIHISEPTRP